MTFVSYSWFFANSVISGLNVNPYFFISSFSFSVKLWTGDVGYSGSDYYFLPFYYFNFSISSLCFSI